MVSTAFALIGFIAWTLALLVLMEAIRTYLVVTGQVPANGFRPDNDNLSPFMQRLARAHANCLEGLPVFGGLLLVAIILEKTASTDRLAPWFLDRANCPIGHPPNLSERRRGKCALYRFCRPNGNWRLLDRRFDIENPAGAMKVATPITSLRPR